MALFLILSWQNQRLITHQPQPCGLGDLMAVAAGHRPDLAMPPRRGRQRMLSLQRASCLTRWQRPLPFGRLRLSGFRLSPSIGPFEQVDQPHEPRSRHARLSADHLEVLEGPRRPSALFFHTRISMAAPPNAVVNSATSSSSCCSLLEGFDLPAWIPSLPASRN